MPAVTDFANAAAAVSAGFKQIDTDRGVAINPRFLTEFEKRLVGAAGDGEIFIRATGDDNTAQATATARALAALNSQRKHYYGGSPGRTSGSSSGTSGKGSTWGTVDRD